MKNTVFRLLPIAALTSMLWACGGSAHHDASSDTSPSGSPAANAQQPTLLVTRDTYDASFSMTGQNLPINNTPEASAASTPGAVPAASGTFPTVFTNDSVDPNFGVTADMQIDAWAPGATSPSLYLDVTKAAQQQGLENIASSFSSKSEDGMNLSQDGTAITFNEYDAPIDALDRSNSNTPGVIDPTNTDVAPPTYRAVVQLNLANKSLSVTNTNAFSGNNGRASVLVGGQYYIVGNAGNSGSTPNPNYGTLDQLTMDTGVQTIAAGSSCAYTQVIGAFQTASSSTYAPAAAGACALGTVTDPLSADVYAKKTTGTGGNQFGFSLAQVSGQKADKTGKDDNFRGLYLGPDGTLYVSKGSGGNGVNTVYQVGAAGALANGGKLTQNVPVAVVPGFMPSGWTGAPAATNAGSTAGWQLSNGVAYPFGMWIPKSNPNLMFVADEGDLTTTASASGGSGGLWVYQKSSSGTWAPIAQLVAGLNLGQPYTVTDAAGTYGTVGANYTTTPDGLRNITGQINADGSFTIYAITSTIGSTAGNASGVTTPNPNFDEGADSNQLVKITVSVNGSSVMSSGFNLMQTAPYGQVLRGVALIPSAN